MGDEHILELQKQFDVFGSYVSCAIYWQETCNETNKQQDKKEQDKLISSNLL